jgi:hypothetical protein
MIDSQGFYVDRKIDKSVFCDILFTVLHIQHS